MTEMIDRVAKAMREMHIKEDWDEDMIWLHRARIAIEAMNDPSAIMIQAGCESFGDLDMRYEEKIVDLDAITKHETLRKITIRSWRWMIKKALH